MPAEPADPDAPPDTERQPSHDEIAERAYFLHREEPGRDQVDNWLAAERELAPERVTPASLAEDDD